MAGILGMSGYGVSALGIVTLLMVPVFAVTRGSSTRRSIDRITAGMETTCAPEYVPAPVSCANSPAMETYRLVPGDIIESDSSDRITAVRHPTNPPTWTRFRTGTATSPPNENVVKRELETE